MRQVFIDSAVRVVARDGMEKTTTKAIASEAKLNEAYIYKCFSGKDDLLSAALHMEDVNFANLLQKTLPIMHMPGLSWKERAYILWKKSWDLILSKPADCIFYIRYYYSASCRAHAYETHLACFQPLIEKSKQVFQARHIHGHAHSSDLLHNAVLCLQSYERRAGKQRGNDPMGI